MCEVWEGVYWIFRVYMLVMLVYAILSWVPSLRGRWTDAIARLVEPVLVPVRRVIPPLGGIDVSFIVVLIVLQIVVSAIIVPEIQSCQLSSY
ncbi:MAG TPA: YggT family protein [Candidatus Baltobacteraceae bacterium]|nr:YggT family protein [Candidatus Baltobacteraceae bacterium]